MTSSHGTPPDYVDQPPQGPSGHATFAVHGTRPPGFAHVGVGERLARTLDRADVTTSYFTAGSTGLRPDPASHGPWAQDMLHGRLIGGLAARAIERELQPRWRVARLTVDLFRPAAMAPVEIRVSPLRRGRRLQVFDAVVTVDGHDVARATAVVLAVGETPPGRIWRPEPEPWPDPHSLPLPEGAVPDERWLFRTVSGGFGTGERTRVWTNETACLVEGEALSPLVRAAITADIACPLGNSSDAGLHYINGDYTLLLGRYPVGDWIGLEVTQQMQADGIAVASANLVDIEGPFATSGGSSLATEPLADET